MPVPEMGGGGCKIYESSLMMNIAISWGLEGNVQIEPPLTIILLVIPLVGLFSSKLVVGFSLLMTFVSVVSSAYLVYILVYVMNKICLVCMPIHIINLLTFILFTVKWRTVGSSTGEERKKVQ